MLLLFYRSTNVFLLRPVFGQKQGVYIICSTKEQNYVPWNLDITKDQETGKICSLQLGFFISKFFSIYFTTTGVKESVRFSEDFVI